LNVTPADLMTENQGSAGLFDLRQNQALLVRMLQTVLGHGYRITLPASCQTIKP
jgi:hypothetical protein